MCQNAGFEKPVILEDTGPKDLHLTKTGVKMVHDIFAPHVFVESQVDARLVILMALQLPRAPSTFWEGVWGGFGGSKYLLRRYLEP